MPNIIKISPLVKKQFKTVEWQIHNVCNYDCSFCGYEIKSGTQRWLDFETYTSVIEKIIDEANKDNKKVWFKITGGEPTLYPKLPELLEFIKQKGAYSYLFTNGSRTLDYWKRIAESNIPNFLHITFHPEQTTNIDHVISVANLYAESNTYAVFSVTALPNFFEQALSAHNKILNEAVNSASSLIAIADNNLDLNKYSESQRKTLIEQSDKLTTVNDLSKKLSDIHTYHRFNNIYYHNIIATYSDKSKKLTTGMQLQKNDENYFENWTCYAGIESIRINYETIVRSVCNVGPNKSIYDNNFFYEDAVICPKFKCQCKSDIAIEKYKS